MKQANRSMALVAIVLIVFGLGVFTPPLWAHSWNGKVVLQAFWWDAWNAQYPQD
jgi:hypothetical protein